MKELSVAESFVGLLESIIQRDSWQGLKFELLSSVELKDIYYVLYSIKESVEKESCYSSELVDSLDFTSNFFLSFIEIVNKNDKSKISISSCSFLKLLDRAMFAVNEKLNSYIFS